MISGYREIENSYIENFSYSTDVGDYIVFCDEKLPDMYSFNCTLVKENMKRDLIEAFLSDYLKAAKVSGKDFLKILVHPQISITDSEEKCIQNIGFQTQTNLYMKIDGQKCMEFRANEQAQVIVASTEEQYEAGRLHDIETCVSIGIPEEFAIRKTLRKKDVFQDKNKALRLYLCYFEKCVIGHCEMHIMDGYAKIEDFDVVERCQRNGFGTAILKRAISDAVELGIKNIYLITDKHDTPRQMYSKLGFEIIGEELELFWKK